jgi:hypothetical protein
MGWAEVAVDATDVPRKARLGAIVLSACALPGVMSGAARAEEAPDRAVIEIKVSGYRDAQDKNAGDNAAATVAKSSAQGVSPAQGHATISSASGGSGSSGGSGGQSGVNLGSNLLDRIVVTSPSIYALVPLGRQWAVDGTLTVDEISGASPAYYTNSSSFVHFHDRRIGGDAKLTRYFERAAVSLGVASSKESDYTSNAVSAAARFSSDNQNTTLNIGVGLTRDLNNPNNQLVHDAHKGTHEYQVGLTQALSSRDLVQINYTRSVEDGYLNDPYKSYDNRPDRRAANVLQTRWNHWLDGTALKLGYRYYGDTFGIRSHTFDLALAVPTEDDGRSTFTPSLRYYTQSAASFYVNPDPGSASYPAPQDQSGFYSLDQRLSAYGAISVGAKYDWAVDSNWSMDAKLDVYRQQSGLRIIGQGSPGLSPLSAFIWQIGIKRTF